MKKSVYWIYNLQLFWSDLVAHPRKMTVVTPRTFKFLCSKRVESLSDPAEIEPSKIKPTKTQRVARARRSDARRLVCMYYVSSVSNRRRTRKI